MAKFIPAIFDDVADYHQRLRDERNKKDPKQETGTWNKEERGDR